MFPDARDSTPVPGWAARMARFRAVSEKLATLDDQRILALLEESSTPTAGIGGSATTVVVDGVPVFVKRVPLTDLDLLRENVGSTANIFRLPTFYQYGIGSTGFGAWREVAVHDMTTRWVVDRRFHGFPMLYHRRVLPQPPATPDLAGLERWVRHWEGDSAVRARLEAISTATSGVALFMEYVPYTVDAWLTARTAAGGEAADAAYAFVDRALREGAEFMRAQGLTHFDAHFRNLLTDGHRLYFADFGLATHSGFDLDATESAFLRRHRDYDRGYTVAHLTQWLLSNLLGLSWSESLRHASDVPDPGLSGAAARIVARHAAAARVMGDFHTALMDAGKRTPFPADELGGALLRVGRRRRP